MLNFHLISIFPDSFDSYINESIIKRAQAKKKIKIKKYNPRDFTKDKHKKVDDRPYGGGPGMVMVAEPVLLATKKALGSQKGKVVIFSPRGPIFDNNLAKKWAKQKNLVLICGRYEGVDARVKKILKAEEISVGPYVLTGGELPALVVLDAVARQISGVLGKDESIEENRVAGAEVYTRPEILDWQKKKYRVPPILLSGDHRKIDDWRLDKK